MILTQYLHFPQGNGSYTVAENISKYYSGESVIWAIGDASSGLYTDGSFPVLASHPKSKGKRFSELEKEEYIRYCNKLKESLSQEDRPGIRLVHHGLVIAKYLPDNYPVISYLHGTEMLAEKGLPSYVRKDLFESISLSVKILTMCDNQKQMAEKLFGQNVLGKLEILPGGIDTSIFHPRNNKNEIYKQYSLNPKKKIILYAGRLTYEKDLELIIDAFDDSLSKDTQLILVGSGNQYEILKKRAEGKDVKFIPAVPQTELSKIMSAADLFVLTSRYEAFGLVLLEAIASGIPSVASSFGFLPELIRSPRGGYTFKREDNHDGTVTNVKNAVHKALSIDKKTLSEYSDYIRNTYSWENVVQKFEKIVQDI